MSEKLPNSIATPIATAATNIPSTDYYSKQIKAKIQEIDKQITTVLTIPQYSRHLRTYTGGEPRSYYQTDKYHYMSVGEHLCKLYEVDPYIYGERDDAYKNKPPYSHVYPCSSGCPQCSHIPVYINPYDPYRQNPPVLDSTCNKPRQKRWIEFTELNEYQVIREEIEEAYDAGNREYVPRVRSQVIMPIEEARRLVFLMQQDNFSYEDYFGRSPGMIAKPREIMNKEYLDDQLQLIENVGGLRQMLREQGEKQKELEEEIERLRKNGNNNNNNNNNDGDNGGNGSVNGSASAQYTLQVPAQPRKKKIFEDDGLNYYTKRNFQQQKSPARNEQTTIPGESSLRNIPEDTFQKRMVQIAPSSLDVNKKYNQYSVKPSQRDMGNLKTVKHEDPTYQSHSEFFEAQRRQQSITSMSQIDGIQRKFKPSSQIKLLMRQALPNEQDEYYDHQTSLTDINQQAQSDAQHFGQEVTVTTNNVVNGGMQQQQTVGSSSRQNILQVHNQRVASLTNLDLSNSFSRLPPPDSIKKSQNSQIQQVLEQYYEETPHNI